MVEIKTQTADSEDYHIPVLTKRAKVGLALAAGVAVGSGLVAVQHGSSGPEFTGQHKVKITEDTVTDIAHEHVEGSSDHIGATVDKIVEMNPDVFQDGKAYVESEDLGKEIDVPQSVEQ